MPSTSGTTTTTSSSTTTSSTCTKPSCFFCIVKEPDSGIRRAGISSYFREMPVIDGQERVLVLSSLWTIAMKQPDDPEFPYLGIFECMVSLLYKSISEREWLLTDQNIYIPYYAAHIIGSYTMNTVEFAEKAVEAGVIPVLLELLRGKLSWVEQRVAVRALGHLASYETTFQAIAAHEEEVVKLAMHLASTCLEVIFNLFVNVEDEKERLKYHCDLLTRGVGGFDVQNRKAEEWASQTQCWSIHLLNCFAIKERSIDLICDKDFLKDLCEMWGGLVNDTSPAGVGLIRILCYSKIGRSKISESEKVIQNLCNLARSSDDWQYMGIDCLLLLLKDSNTRYKVLGSAALYLIDLIELRNLGGRSKFGQRITWALLRDFKQRKTKIKNIEVQRALEEIWASKVGRGRREKSMSDEEVEAKRVIASLIKQQGNHKFCLGKIEAALLKYTEALNSCPLQLRKERVVLYSNRSQCHLLLGDADAAISDTTRALCLSNPPNSHVKSLWRRSQAYDMKGRAKESLMDCLLFVNGCGELDNTKQVKPPYYAVRMINKQMEFTWLFATARSKLLTNHPGKVQALNGGDENNNEELTSEVLKRLLLENKGFISSLSTIFEEPAIGKGGSSMRKMEWKKKTTFDQPIAKQIKPLYYMVRMINKQMESSWLFATARSKLFTKHPGKIQPLNGGDEKSNEELTSEVLKKMLLENKGFMSSLSTILEEPVIGKGGSIMRKPEKSGRKKKTSFDQSM